MTRPAPAAEVRLNEFNPIEVRGLHLVQSQVLQLAGQVEQLRVQLAAAEHDAASLLADRVPSGVTIRQLRIDVARNAVFAPAPPTVPAP